MRLAAHQRLNDMLPMSSVYSVTYVSVAQLGGTKSGHEMTLEGRPRTLFSREWSMPLRGTREDENRSRESVRCGCPSGG